MNFTPNSKRNKPQGAVRITQVSAITNGVKCLPLADQLGALIVRADDSNMDFLIGQWVNTCRTNGNPIITAVVDGDSAAVTIDADEETIDRVHELNPDANRTTANRLAMEFPIAGLDLALLDLHFDAVSF